MPDPFAYAADAIVHALGEDVQYNGATVRAVFGAGFRRVESNDVRVSSTRPEVFVTFAALATEPAQGDTVVIRGTTYTVATVRPDVEGTGATLTLKRV